MKSGVVEQASLNYNTENQSIVFIKDGKYLTLTGLESVDTIYVDDKKFIPFREHIYEVATPAEEIPLLVTYSNKVKPIVATVDHTGGNKQVGSQVSNTLSDNYLNRSYRGNFQVEFVRHFILRKRYAFYKVNNERQLLKVFPENEGAISKYIDENNVNFSSLLDMISLVVFCNEQNKKH
jgi:hypothetical protein